MKVYHDLKRVSFDGKGLIEGSNSLTNAIWKIVPFLFLWLIALSVNGQRILDTQYFFGNSNNNFVFDKNGREIYVEERMATPFGSGGSGVISDQYTGNLLFYTDGVQIFDQSHNLIDGFTALSGDSSLNQAAVVSPNPNASNQYYIFTNSGSSGPNEIQYTILDASLQGNSSNSNFPFGSVVSSNNSTGLTDPSEGMIIIENGSGNSYWLITQNRNTFQFQVTSISQSGIGTTQSYDITSAEYPGAEISQYAFNSDSSWLAIAPKTPNRNVAILDFDLETGELSFNQQVTLSGFDDGLGESIYDVEWSATGSNLFFSRFGSNSNDANLYQYNVDSAELTTILTDPIFRSLGLKRGIDDNILHLYQETANSPLQIGQIETFRMDSLVGIDVVGTDTIPIISVTDSVIYSPAILSEDFQGRQFPAFAPPNFTQFNNVRFLFFDDCFQQSIKFVPVTDTIPTSYQWDFGDGSGSNNAVPVHTYAAEGAYQVRLTVQLNDRISTVAEFVEIRSNNVMVDLGNDTTICVDEVLTLDAGDEGIGYTWSTGETSQTIEVDTTGTYWVEVLTPNGCTSFDAIEVTEYGISRNLANQWYFGEMAGLDFNLNPPAALVDDNMMNSPEGCATISDSDGSLLFYTNGNTIWNKDHQVMVNGDSIGGDSTAAQSALILPFTDDETIFYVFSTEEVYGDFDYRVLLSIVDIKDDTARGSVVIKGIPLMDFNTERLTASVFGSPGWLLSHEFGNNNFKANFIDDSGIGETIHTPLGTFLEFLQEQHGTSYLRFQPGIARAANMIPGDNLVDLLDFDGGEGTFSNPRTLNTNEPSSTPLYGLEFSGDGNRMYLTTTGGSSKLIQYDLDSIDGENPVEDIEATKFDGYAGGSGYGALQRGPNGVIYLAVDNSGSVLTIDAPAGDDDGASFNTTGTDLGGRISRLGLPNFTQSVNDPSQPPGFTVESACLGQPLTLLATGTSDIDEFEWTFDEFASPQAGVGDSIQVTYSTTGPHTITLRIFNRCGYDSLFTGEVEVFTIPEDPIVPDNVALCNDEVVLEAWAEDDPDLSYVWSTGETTRTITVTEPSVVDVFILNSNGCPSDTIEVFVGGNLTVGLEDQSICQDEEVSDLDAQNAVGIFNWTIDGASASTTRFQEIETSVPGTYVYALEYIEEVSGCIAVDSANITILENPVATAIPTPPSECGADDGVIDLRIDSNGSFSFSLRGTESRAAQSFDGPGITPSFTELSSGSYFVDIQNIVNGCLTTIPVLIEDDAPFDLEITPVPSCGSDGDLLVEFSGFPPTTVDINVTDDEGMEIRTISSASVPVGLIENLDTGTYIIEVREVGGAECVQIDSVTLGEAFPQSNFTFTPVQELCGNRDEAFVTPGNNGTATFVWQDASGETVGIGESINITFDGLYTVTATGEDLCPRTEEIQIDINPFPSVEILVEGDLCVGEVNLTANVDSLFSGPFNYSWTRNGETSELQQTRTITVTEEGTYQVRIIDPTIGCEATSIPVDVDCEPRINAPNAFSPNNNGENENFFVFPNDFVDNFEIFIYSRWGELVFFSNNIDFRWNGEFQGKLLPEGTYATVIKFTSQDEPELGVIEQYGSVTLIR